MHPKQRTQLHGEPPRYRAQHSIPFGLEHGFQPWTLVFQVNVLLPGWQLVVQRRMFMQEGLKKPTPPPSDDDDEGLDHPILGYTVGSGACSADSSALWQGY